MYISKYIYIYMHITYQGPTGPCQLGPMASDLLRRFRTKLAGASEAAPAGAEAADAADGADGADGAAWSTEIGRIGRIGRAIY